MFLIGTSLIVGAILFAAATSLAYILVVNGQAWLLRWGRAGIYATLGTTVAVAGLVLALFLMQRYDFRYVYDYSSKELELRYRIAAVWAGQSGSLIVWALSGLLVAPWLIRRTRHFEPYVLGLLMLLQVALLAFMLIRNPFLPTLDPNGVAVVPTDGRGLNPQLHNVWMVIHPPTLFTGYGLLGVPFAFALAGLWRRDYDGWVRLALPWTLAGWGVLGLALTMGGYWAYESLGWGGYWGWDPVENASLVPWLVGTALVHGLVLQKAHGGLRRTNFALAILTYVMVFYASFLTRSGVLSNFSVHSFTEVGLKDVMLGVLAGLLVIGGLFLLLRWRDVPVRPLSESLLSRDTAFMLMILAFLVMGTVVALGTSIPWISSAKEVGFSLQRWLSRSFDLSDGSNYGLAPLTDGRFSLTADFYERTMPPLALVIVLLVSVAPMFGWGDTNRAKLLRSLRWPGLLAVAAVVAGLILGVRRPMSIAYVGLSTFAVATNLLMIVRTLRSGWLRIGGYMAHVGAGLLLIGFVGSYVYASEDLRMVIAQGETQRGFGHDFTFWGYDESRADGHHGLRIEVDREHDPFVAQPEVFFNERMGAWTRTPAIKRYLWRDLYISPSDYLPASDPATAMLVPKQETTIGPYTLRFDGFDVKDQLATESAAEVGATVTITSTSGARVVQPGMRLEVGKLIPLPVDLGGGRRLTLENFVPGTQQVLLRIDGLNLPIQPARAVIEVSTKPAIAFVWVGALLIALGCSMAVVRRRIELRSAEAPARRPLGKASERWIGRRRAPLPGGNSTHMNGVGDDLYARLQLASQASPEEIEAAYLRLSELYSPERLQDAPAEFQELGARRRVGLAEAYAVLRDPFTRAEYDRASSGLPVVETIDYRPLPPAGRHERMSPSVPLPAVAARPDRRGMRKRSPRALLAPLVTGVVVLSILLLVVLSGVRVRSGAAALATPAIPDLTLPYTTAQLQEARKQAEASQSANDWKVLGDMLYDNVMIMRERAPLSPQYLGALPQWLQSTAAYSQALQLGAGPVARADLAVAYLYYGLGANEQAAIDEATVQIEQARKDGPDEPRVLLNYGMVMVGLNPPREDEAVEAWRRITEVAPESVEAQRAEDLIASYGPSS